MKKIIFLVLFVLLVSFNNQLFAQDLQFHGKISNSVYAYEVEDEVQSNIYQYFRSQVKKKSWGNLELNTSFRVLTDVNETLDSDYRYNFYTLNLKMQKLLGNHLDLQVGRQFLHPGTILGGLDGVSTVIRYNPNISLQLYGGVESHFLRSAKIYKPEDALVAGGMFQWQKLWKNNLQIFALHKSNDEVTLWQIAGLNLDNYILPRTMLRVQAHFDTQNERLHRLLASARYRLLNQLYLSAGFKSQYPQIYTNSFYTIFEISQYQQYYFNCAYRLFKNYFVNARYQMLQMDDETANQILVSVDNRNGSLGFIYETGYAGEQLGIMADYAVEIFNKLLLSASVDYSRYKIEEVYEFENQLGNALRVSYQFHPRWYFDLEYQWLKNRFKDSDSRILNHIHFSW